MLDIPVLNIKGEKVGSEQLDPELLGGHVRTTLLKQAIVAYRANQRLGTVNTKSRAMVHGASRKLYKQKGTGNARVGNIRTPTRRGGGHAFHKVNRDFSQKLSRTTRRLARDSAILAKAIAGTVMIVDGLKFDEPKTSKFAGMLKATKTERGVLLATSAPDTNLLKSGRNIPTLAIKLMGDVNAYDVLRARHLMFTPDAFKSLSSEKPVKAEKEIKSPKKSPAKPAKSEGKGHKA